MFTIPGCSVRLVGLVIGAIQSRQVEMDGREDSRRQQYRNHIGTFIVGIDSEVSCSTLFYPIATSSACKYECPSQLAGLWLKWLQWPVFALPRWDSLDA